MTVIPPGEVERAESAPGRVIKSEEVRREKEGLSEFQQRGGEQQGTMHDQVQAEVTGDQGYHPGTWVRFGRGWRAYVGRENVA